MGPDYEKIASLLSANSIFNSVSELHGLVCGQVCSGVNTVKPLLTQQLMGIEDSFPPLIAQLITRLSADIEEQVGSTDFSFQPLLPGDEEELGIRLRALGEWCESFNIGFAATIGKNDQSLLEETREVLKDFSAFSEIEDSPKNDSDMDENEEDEENYMEVVEYVRMAVNTVFMQNGTITADRKPEAQSGQNPDASSIH